ncbi:AlgP family protein [Stutzerimonas stutzeri]|uniref:AlgP family protein n=1 Tax=Stutzerimonas stutzeri TaxID=316 RepID=UPI00210D15BF|nr:AlgP family protein [Stutzerimonas stutzeri]MCQ4257353.1 AlgP family protein [Stutzerimonas stutzeri]
MPAKKPSVTTPLHLLQQLSNSLVEHLQKACSEAQLDAEMLLAKLEKQRGRTQEKIIKARAKLDEAGNAGKSKSQTKARSRLSELDDMLAVLQARQSETLTYLSELKRDAEQSMQLAQGVTKVEQAAAQALAARAKPAAARAAAAKKSPARSAKGTESAARPASAAGKVAAEKAAEKASAGATGSAAGPARPAARSGSRAQANKPVATSAKPATARQGSGADAGAAASSAKPAAAKKTTPRKPAATKRPATTQSPPAAK